MGSTSSKPEVGVSNKEKSKAKADVFGLTSTDKNIISDGHDASEMMEEEDESDLRYDRDLKILLEDHRYVTKFIMVIAIVAMFCQIAFAVWSIMALANLGSWEDALLINWYHLLKILLNIYVS